MQRTVSSKSNFYARGIPFLKHLKYNGIESVLRGVSIDKAWYAIVEFNLPLDTI